MITAPVNFKLATFMSTLASKFATFSVRRALPLAMLMIGVGLNSAHGQAIKAGVPKKAVVPPKPTIGLPTIPSLQVTYSPSTTLVAGQPYSVTWVSRNAEAVDFYCTASGTGYADSQTLGLSGTINGTASAAWVGYPSDCTWVADNSEGVVSVKATLTTQAAPLPPPVPVDNAQFISQVPPPAVLIRGQTYTYSVTMKNTGTTTWSSAGTNPYRLGNSYEYIWGVGRIELASSVPPGALGTFNLTVTVPVTAPLGPNPFQWKMLREGVQWFGEATPNVAITVQAPPPELVDNAQFVSQVAPPSVLIPGQSYSYSITMKNTGTTTWTSGGNAPYRLATVNEFAWGGARIELAGPVQPGAVGTFNVSATVPPTEALGTKTFQWRMVHENVQWFGDTTPGLAVTVQAPALVDNAQFVSQVPPPSVLIPGQSYSYSITMKNIGTTTWTSGGTTPHRLAAVNGLAWGSAVIELAGPVAPGAVGTFNVSATVPPAEVLGTKTFQWRMVRENVQWFGDTTPGVAITVQAPALVDNAQFVSQVPPPSVLIPGQSYSYSITMKNIGTTTWISGGTTPHRLAAVNGLAWGSAVIELAGPVPPGAVGTFNVSATVPPAEALGSKTFQWRMVRENVQWFGDTTPGVAITVQAPALVDNAQFVSQVPPPSVLIPGQSYSYSITMKNIGTTTWTSGGTTPYRLAAVNGLAWGSAVIELAGPVPPGAVGTFNVSATVPPAEVLGTKTFQWRMVRENLQWFGDTTPGVAITVQAPPALVDNAQFVSQVPPPSVLTQGQSYSYSVTMRNVGTTTWTSGGANPYRLGSANLLDNTTWGTARIELASTVLPGGVGTFNFTATVPATASSGLANFQWRMVHEMVQWFGENTPNVVITIQRPQLPGRVEYIHTDGLGSPVARTDQNGGIISRTRYEPYGYTAAGAVPTIGFTGHVNDSETGLVYMQQRYYDPVAGRFLSIDPVTTDANTGSSFNRYNYTNNNPYKYTDPDGRQAKEPSDLCAGQSRMNCGTLGTITVSSDPGTKKGAAAGSAGASSPGSSPSNTGYEQGGAYEMNIMGDPMSTSAPYVGGMQVVAGTTLVVGTGAVIVTGGAAATGTVQVTSWAPAGVVPDLAAGRWVMMGGPTLSNYIRTFLWGPKYVPGIGFVGATSPFANSVTGNVAAVSVRLPPSWEVWKAAFGQRFLK